MPDAFAQKLLDAADEIDDLSRSELQVLLRRASLRVSNKTQPAGTSTLIREVAEVLDTWAAMQDMSRDDAVNAALIEWAVAKELIEVDDLDEEA